jgi:hypothetical protein
MPQLTLTIGVLLTILGIGGYLLGFQTGGEDASITALIPAFAGVPIAICGVIAMQSTAARKHAMHAAVAIALLGVLATLMPLFSRILNPEVSTSWLTKTSVIGMLALCLVLVIAGVRSFVAARRARAAA